MREPPGVALLGCLVTVALYAACPEPPVPPTADDLESARWLVHGGTRYPFRLERGGLYYCGPAHPAGRTHWKGTWRLLPDGEVALCERACDENGEGGPGEVRLRLRRAGGRLEGTGWGTAVSLER